MTVDFVRQTKTLIVQREKRKSFTHKKTRSAFFRDCTPRECWQLSMGGNIGAFLCLVRTTAAYCLTFFQKRYYLLMHAPFLQKMVPFTLESEAYFPKCASWRITPLECLWEESERERKRESEREKYKSCFDVSPFQFCRFNSTVNWEKMIVTTSTRGQGCCGWARVMFFLSFLWLLWIIF